MIILFLISFFPIGNIGLKYLENDFIEKLNLEKIDNIIVLSGSEDLETTLITNRLNLNEASERLVETVNLGNKFKQAKIIHVGGNANILRNNKSDLIVAKKFFNSVKFDISRVLFIGNTRNTIENFSEIRKLNLSGSSNLLITSAFHMKRALIISKNFDLSLIPYAVDFRSYSNKTFLNRFQSFNIVSNLTDFNLFFREIIGILVFKLIY